MEWRLGHRPALDGLRGVAILLVVVAHLGIVKLWPAGGAGVTMFFTLSGFLITALLLGESSRTGRVSFRRFYWHRVLRLAPAFVLLLAIVWPVEYLLDGNVPYWWATLLEGGNWISALEGPGALSLLHHTWSLAIEEQFYLVWPVVLLVAGRHFGRNGVIVVASVGIVASVVSANLLTAGPRTSFGTDTNASSLLIGCVLAALMVNREAAHAPAWVLPLGLGMVAVAADPPWSVSLPVISVGTALAIWAICTRGSRWLAARPLVFAGRISYGWYLWNYPVTLLTLRADGPMWTVPLVSLGIALLSWRYVEQPFLRMKDRGSDRVVVGVGAGV